MNLQDLGVYLMIWLISNALIWILDINMSLPVKTKILIPVTATGFIALLRIAIYFMTGV